MRVESAPSRDLAPSWRTRPINLSTMSEMKQRIAVGLESDSDSDDNLPLSMVKSGAAQTAALKPTNGAYSSCYPALLMNFHVYTHSGNMHSERWNRAAKNTSHAPCRDVPLLLHALAQMDAHAPEFCVEIRLHPLALRIRARGRCALWTRRARGLATPSRDPICFSHGSPTSVFMK